MALILIFLNYILIFYVRKDVKLNCTNALIIFYKCIIFLFIIFPDTITYQFLYINQIHNNEFLTNATT